MLGLNRSKTVSTQSLQNVRVPHVPTLPSILPLQIQIHMCVCLCKRYLCICPLDSWLASLALYLLYFGGMVF